MDAIHVMILSDYNVMTWKPFLWITVEIILCLFKFKRWPYIPGNQINCLPKCNITYDGSLAPEIYVIQCILLKQGFSHESTKNDSHKY